MLGLVFPNLDDSPEAAAPQLFDELKFLHLFVQIIMEEFSIE